MNLGIAGKTALVTASSGGMGRNIAHALAAEGVNVVLFARSLDKLEEAARDIREKHGVQALKQARMIGDPVEGGGRDDAVDLATTEVELEQVHDRELDVGVCAEALARGVDHRGRSVKRDHVSRGQALQQ